MGILLQAVLWLLRKFGVALAVVAAILLAGALYLYLEDNLRSESERAGAIERLRAQAAALGEKVAALDRQVAHMREEIEIQRQRAEIARRLLASYEEMNTFWDWLFGTAVDRDDLAARQKNAQAQSDEAVQRVGALMSDVGGLLTERDAASTELSRTSSDILRLENAGSPVAAYLRRSWDKYRWPLAFAVGAYFFGPTLWKVFAYHGLAPLILRARPIRLSAAAVPAVSATQSRVSESIDLPPGEAVFLRERYLQASDEALRRHTRFVLDWRIPLTCAATGLVELVELRNSGSVPAAVTVSTQDDAAIELSVVEVPPGSGVVLRPSHLAGIAFPRGRRLRIRRHWRLFHLQSWLTLQFRFFEFLGPCRLVLAGTRGVRAENLAAAGGPRARRTNRDSTIGFTPDLAYRSVRAETFWSYYRGRNPLFDDLFTGHGTFFCQEIATAGPGAKARRFWEVIWNGLLKVFGM